MTLRQAFGNSDDKTLSRERLERWDVDCSQDPHDLRPALRAIMARYRILRMVNPDKPIVVLMAEIHANPAHHMLRAMLIEQIHRAFPDEKTTLAYERPHPFNDSRLAHRADFGKRPSEALGDLDPQGRIALEMVMANVLPHLMGAPVGISMAFANAHAIDDLGFACTDVDYGPDGRVRMNDYACLARENLMRVLAERLPGQTVKAEELLNMDWQLEVQNPVAMSIRNRHMAQEIEALIAMGRNTVVQGVGVAHLLGHIEGEYEFRDSLYALMDNEDAIVIPVFPECELMQLSDAIDERYLGITGNLVVLKGLTEENFDYRNVMDLDKSAHNDYAYKEMAFITKLAQASGEDPARWDYQSSGFADRHRQVATSTSAFIDRHYAKRS